MNLSARFIERPVGTTLLAMAVAMAGAIAFAVLPVAPLPQVDFPTISVSASLPGAQCGNHGLLGGDAAGASVQPHRRGVDEMTSAEFPGQHPGDAAV